MWKKGEVQAPAPAPGDVPKVPTPPATAASRVRATIGPSIVIRGDVTGSEDILIQGRVDGSVNLDKHAIGVGTEGQVNANITGRVITIEGKVEGDLTAREQIVLRGSAHVQGDITAPRVVLEDGATFRGLVDMSAASTDNEPARTATTRGSAVEARAEAAAAPDAKPDSTSSGSTGTSGRSKPPPSSSGRPEKSRSSRVDRART